MNHEDTKDTKNTKRTTKERSGCSGPLFTPFVLFVFFVSLWFFPHSRAQADPPAAAGAAVVRFMEALHKNDAAVYFAAIAEDYDYNGQKKSDLPDPFGSFGIVYDQFLYRVRQVIQTAPGVATAIVDANYTGQFNLEAINAGRPAISGTARFWIEVRRQRDGGWLVSAGRYIRLRFVHADTPETSVAGMTVNGLSSVRVAAGGTLKIAGATTFGVTQYVQLGGKAKQLSLSLKINEPWSTDLTAPMTAGRYYVDTASVTLVPRSDTDYYVAWDEVTVPVVVR
jgi:hypothetical protein